jgi:hypothetical protein
MKSMLHRTGFTILTSDKEMRFFSGGIGNSDILQQPDTIRLLLA